MEPALSQAQGPTAPRELSEDEKVTRLINRVRSSGRVFLRGRREVTAGEFADHMQATHDQHRTDMRSARELVERATRPDERGRRFRVREPDGTEAQAGDWLHDQLDAIERGQDHPSGMAAHASKAPPPAGRGASIDRLLGTVASSGLTFLVPQRKGPPRPLDAGAFADLLQDKWRWLGPDIQDPETFIRELASEPFANFAPYRVRLPDGTEEDVAPWLTRQLRKGAEPRTAAPPPSTAPPPVAEPAPGGTDARPAAP